MQDQNQNQTTPNYGQSNYAGGMQSPTAVSYKSATTAGLLGIFLGAIGVHNFYLGEKKKGIIHVAMAAGAFVVDIIALAILPNALSWYTLYKMAWFLTLLNGAANLALAASGIWGLVEGIQILTQGDAGLARRGFAVAPQPQMPASPYAAPAQPAQPFTQPAAPAAPAPESPATPEAPAPEASTAPAEPANEESPATPAELANEEAPVSESEQQPEPTSENN